MKIIFTQNGGELLRKKKKMTLQKRKGRKISNPFFLKIHSSQKHFQEPIREGLTWPHKTARKLIIEY